MLIMAGRRNGTLDYGAGALDTGRLRAGYEIATQEAMIPNRAFFLTGNC
jgi:glycine cleavage system aminomethyltransferase T